ncbi:hypothetical protein V5O48_001607 [Marasmius crinis-equi]|uniref:BED-type domain-containing protein n=1 Tax=Marasmius crinis-equi TaxID=585013 RepID=A0ABR3FZ03_9AGAR
MDPSPNDPNTLFLHPPFTNFPDVDKHPEGLTYNLLAENRGWFLDAADFISYEETATPNPSAIAYPTTLEPPRGWCPARKKDLKSRGADWPEGEEPRLRCTFCRRTYAGVNAKSMWRRHVFEKHKIAMANRRDGPDRPRGRGSGATKENRQPKHDRIVNIDVVPQALNTDPSQRSKFRSSVSSERSDDDPEELTDTLPAANEPGPSSSSNPSPTHPSSSTPPLTPHGRSSDPASGSDDIPLKTPGHFPSSPYDPSLTPDFRHCSPTRPSEQPWRWDSPSNPLLPARNLSLSVLAGELKDSPLLALGKGGTSKNPSLTNRSPLLSLGTPDTNVKNRRFFPRFPIPSHLVDSPFAQSPLSRKPLGGTHRKTLSGVSDDWSLDPTSPLPVDPFVGGEASLAEPLLSMSTTAESPVIRRDLSRGHGLGIGLLEPFTLHGNQAGPPKVNGTHDGEDSVPGSLANSPRSTPFPKRRRIFGPS